MTQGNFLAHKSPTLYDNATDSMSSVNFPKTVAISFLKSVYPARFGYFCLRKSNLFTSLWKTLLSGLFLSDS